VSAIEYRAPTPSRGMPHLCQRKVAQMTSNDPAHRGTKSRSAVPAEPGSAGAQVAVLALMLAILGLSWLLVAGTGTPLAGGRRLAFVSDRDGNWEIYHMDLQGLGVARLTNTPAEEWLPAWSPDGLRLAFVSDRDGGWEIYELNVQDALRDADRGGAENLTRHPGDDWDPAWSPDGTRLAFSSYRDGNWEVYVMPAPGLQAQVNLEGSDRANNKQTNLTRHPANDWLPSWSPDGRSIAFVSDRDGNWEIYWMRVDGSEQTNLTRNPGDDWVPAWSPDGQYIAFQSARDGNWEIYVMPAPGAQAQVDANGSGPTNLTRHPADDWDAAWSPDGRYLAFMSERDGNRELYVMPAPGLKAQVGIQGGRWLMRLTHNLAVDKNACWAP
jgi:Tol biopolymer transport system component